MDFFLFATGHYILIFMTQILENWRKEEPLRAFRELS